MAEYAIHWSTWANAYTEVEADSLEEAVQASYEHLPGSLCHQCADKVDVGDDWTETSITVDGEEIDLAAASPTGESR
jgi:hypothetical protein